LHSANISVKSFVQFSPPFYINTKIFPNCKRLYFRNK